MKIALIPGHNSRAQGAVRADDGMSEFEWNTGLASIIMDLLPRNIEGQVFSRRPDLGWPAEIKDVYARADETCPDATIEMHFNASANPRARGCGVLHHPRSRRGKALARELAPRMADAIAVPLWKKSLGGVMTPQQASGDAQRGLYNLSESSAPSVLLESYFGSSPDDCTATSTDAQRIALAKAVVGGVMAWGAQ